MLGLGHESIHLTAVDIGRGIIRTMRPATIEVVRIVIWLDTLLRCRVIHANRWNAILHWNTIGSRVGAKVTIEGAVLLHDDNHMLDFADTRLLLRRLWGT